MSETSTAALSREPAERAVRLGRREANLRVLRGVVAVAQRAIGGVAKVFLSLTVLSGVIAVLFTAASKAQSLGLVLGIVGLCLLVESFLLVPWFLLRAWVRFLDDELFALQRAQSNND